MKRFRFFSVGSMFFILFLFAELAGAKQAIYKSSLNNSELISSIQKICLPFIPNGGQMDKRVKFYANTFGGTVFVTREGDIVYSLPNFEESGKTEKGWVLREQIVGGTVKEVKAEKKALTKVSYFKGNDPSQWKNKVTPYSAVSLGEIYKGIELKLSAHGNNVEKLFYINPDAKAEVIKIKLEGANGVNINENGELEVATELGAVRFTRPVAYQEINGRKIYVAANYKILTSSNAGLMYGFNVDDYNQAYPLIIDPLLASTFIGGSSNDYVYNLALDSSGNVFVTGFTYSSDYPTTSGAYDTSYNGGNHDIIVSKFDGDLTTLLASSFIGGSSYEHPHDIIVDSGGNISITGTTSSYNYPTASGAYDTSQNGGYDVLVTKLDNNLTTLLASTFIGGSGSEDATNLALDSAGDIIVVGVTGSENYPTTVGAYDASYNGGGDVFVSKLDSDMTHLRSSTFIGGSGYDDTYALAIDTSGDVFVAGYTSSSNYPTTSGAYDTSYNGGTYDIFVSKLNSNLSNLLSSTFIGGSGTDFSSSIVLDPLGNIIIAGWTTSSSYPTTSGAYDTSQNGGSDVIVSKLNNTLTNVLASTFIGGSNDDSASALATDSSGHIFTSGYTSSSSYPCTSGAYDTSYNGGSSDGFISKLNGDLSTLSASTFVGGSNDEYAYALAIDGTGNVFFAGWTSSSDYPTAQGAFETSHNGGYDGFVSKLDSRLSSNRPPVANAGPDQAREMTSCAGASVILDGSASSDPDNDPLTYTWTENGSVIATGVNPTVTLSYGTHTITLTVDDGKGGTATDEVLINVVDTTAPTLKVSLNLNMLWPPNHKYVTVTPAITVTDACAETVTVQRLSATSNEPDNGLGDGDTANDIVINTDGTISLRAERSGKGSGRIYTITYQATDIAGNTTTASATVTVPHNK